MPLRAVRSPSNRTLWETCVEHVLGELGDCRGPGGYPSFLLLTHRIQRDAVFAAAARRGHPGWLAPPVAFFSDLPRMFGIAQRPAGLLRRRLLIGELAAAHGLEPGMAAATGFDRGGIAHAADTLFGELLPEGVTPEQLADALAALDGDEFAVRRNEWLVATYRAYLDRLRGEDRYDFRAIHAMVAERIAAGGLRRALGGAERLHIYGPTSQRTRRHLMEALKGQGDVDVIIYLPAEDESSEWDEFVTQVESLPPAEPCGMSVQPAPDGRRELEWVALQVKELVVKRRVQPHEIAVVARMGRDDTRRAHEIFRAAGIPATARVRCPLAEVPALKAVLQLFRGAARRWSYRPLRHVLESAYFDIDVSLRSADHVARERRVEGLDRWAAELCRLQNVSDGDKERNALRREGIFPDRLRRDCEAFQRFVDRAASLGDSRPVTEWIAVTLSLLKPGWFDFRNRLCRDDGGRWDIVRMDQQAVEALERMLGEWRAGADDAEAIGPEEWYARLRRALASNEIALSTPLRTGVQILEAHEAALFPFEHTFVVHANDGEFPRVPFTGVFFSDEERTALVERGLPLANRHTALRRERTLWRAVTNNPHVTVTYRTADADGVPLLPSLMVPRHDPTDEIPRKEYIWPTPFNEVHARRAAMRRLARSKRESRGDGVVTPAVGPLRHAVFTAHAESQRREGRAGSDRPAGAPGPWSGHLRDPWLLDYLARRFGDDRIWSASQLEGYAQCPFVYLIQRVLWLDELAEAEEETTALAAGSVSHKLLERFYSAFDGPYPAELAGETEELYRRLVAEVFAEEEGVGETWLGAPPLWAVTRRQIEHRVADFLRWELRLFEGRRPHRSEFAFGDHEADAVELTGCDVAGASTRIRLRGRIDRVDVAPIGGEERYYVVDYKSSRTPTTGWYMDGGALQTPLYMAALAQKLGVTVEAGCYRSIKNRGNGGEVRWEDERFRRALSIAFSIPQRVRRGLFEPRATRSTKWQSYWPNAAVTRVQALYDEGSRFDD